MPCESRMFVCFFFFFGCWIPGVKGSHMICNSNGLVRDLGWPAVIRGAIVIGFSHCQSLTKSPVNTIKSCLSWSVNSKSHLKVEGSDIKSAWPRYANYKCMGMGQLKGWPMSHYWPWPTAHCCPINENADLGALDDANKRNRTNFPTQSHFPWKNRQHCAILCLFAGRRKRWHIMQPHILFGHWGRLVRVRGKYYICDSPWLILHTSHLSLLLYNYICSNETPAISKAPTFWFSYVWSGTISNFSPDLMWFVYIHT